MGDRPCIRDCARCGIRFTAKKTRIRFCSRHCAGLSPHQPIEIRFWKKVKIGANGGCLEWTGSRKPDGYGSLTLDRKLRSAHRVSWELSNGPIPEGLCVLHRCDNPPCVNPEHLFLGTHSDNALDKVKKGRGTRGKNLTDSIVMAIRADPRNQRAIAAQYGCHQTTVSAIKRGKGYLPTTPPYMENGSLNG
jgi:hypothetical protein